jgi:predicted nucleic acid-binding protein
MATRPTHIADACAAIAYVKGEEGHEQFTGILRDTRNSVAIHRVNFCEFYYDFLRSDGAQTAERAHQTLAPVVTILDPAGESFLKRVARWKIGHACAGHVLGIADAFAAATAEEYACPLITLDHGDFDPVDDAGLLQFVWLR